MTKPIVVDGHTYKTWDDVPDFGSIENVGSWDKYRRAYQGLSTDLGKLPKYDDLASGSYCDMLDTGERYIYHKQSREWIVKKNSGGGGGGGGGEIPTPTDGQIDETIDDAFGDDTVPGDGEASNSDIDDVIGGLF